MKDAVDSVLRTRLSGQIIENFRRRRWKQRLGRHIGDVIALSSNQRTCSFRCCGRQYQLRASGGLARFNSSSENALA